VDSQIGLRQSTLQAQLAQALAEPDADITLGSGHSNMMAVGFLLRVGHALHIDVSFLASEVKKCHCIASQVTAALYCPYFSAYR
jgi:hypothetical protein